MRSRRGEEVLRPRRARLAASGEGLRLAAGEGVLSGEGDRLSFLPREEAALVALNPSDPSISNKGFASLPNSRKGALFMQDLTVSTHKRFIVTPSPFTASKILVNALKLSLRS